MYRSDGRQCDIVVVYRIARRIDFLLGIGICLTTKYDSVLCGEVFREDSKYTLIYLILSFMKRFRYSYGIFFYIKIGFS